MTRRAVTAGLLALVAVLGAAPATAQSWPADATQLQGGPAHSGTSTEPLAPPLRRLWSVPLTDPSHAVIQSGRAFVLSNVPDGSSVGVRDSVLLSAFELGTGQRLWGPVDLEGSDGEYFWAGHAVGSGVVVATCGRVLRAFSAADGRALWTRDFGSLHVAAPVVADDVVYAVGGRGDGVYDESRLQALDLRTGRTRWSRSVRFGKHSAPTVADGKVFLSTQCGQTYAFRTGDGSRVWKVDAPSCDGGRNAVWSDGRLYTRVGDRGTVRDADTGARLGGFATHTLPALAGDRMFALDLDDTSFEAPSLSAFDTASGERVWRTEVPGLVSAPLVVGDHVYAGGRGTRYPDEGELSALRRSDGRRVWSMPLRSPLKHLEEWHESSPYDGMAASEGVLTVATAHEFVVLAPEGYAPPPPTGPTPVSEHHARLGGDAGPLGPPMSGLLPTSDRAGSYTSYLGGVVYWSPATGAHALRGAVLYRWHGLGGVRGPLGFPTSDERTAADGRGRWSAFTGGQVRWSPTTGAHDVRGAVLRRWQALGAERGVLGYPRAGELATSDGRGRYSRFSGGSVYWSPDTGAHEVRGAIRRTWTDLGAERSALRLPVSGERSAGDGRGRFNDFQRGSVYWSPTTGAHEVRGAVRTRWLALGGVRSRLGYPVGDEVGVEAGQLSRFEHGWILWDRTTGKITVRYL